MFDYKTKSRIILDVVSFEDVKISYSINEDLHIVFNIDPLVSASTRDWVGIYQAGWESYESCLTYKWGIGLHYKNSCRTRILTFKSDELSKAICGIHYQFVYVSRYLEILGVSQYFQFSCSPIRELTVKSPPSTANSVKTIGCNVNTCTNDVVTVCGRCEQLFEPRQTVDNHSNNEALSAKVSNLEQSFANLRNSSYFPPNMFRWNEENEQLQLEAFLKKIQRPPNLDVRDGTGEMTSPSTATGKFEPNVIRSLLSTIDNIIEKANWARGELLKLIETPNCGGEGFSARDLVDPNVAGILPMAGSPHGSTEPNQTSS